MLHELSGSISLRQNCLQVSFLAMSSLPAHGLSANALPRWGNQRKAAGCLGSQEHKKGKGAGPLRPRLSLGVVQTAG